jgi:asparagine synthase (glutamine-hydrolysing)
MCGLVGYIDLRGEREVDENVLVRMTEAVVHRGPDSAGYFIEGPVGLGFRRLSIIDPEGGDQPLFNEDSSIVLVCNGEIYNYRELRGRLAQKGHLFRTNCDVEVLPHLYEEESVSCLNKLNGQFSFVLYDRKERSLFLARDQFGINPLFYTVVDDVLIFASEIKAILEHPLAERQVDLTGLDQMLSLPALVSPTTMFKGIKSLNSGHYMTVKNGDIRIAEYWDLDYPRVGEVFYDKPESYYVDSLKEVFERSVKYRLQADVPVGFYLSGGLDSSMIAAMINRVSPSASRHSFSVVFSDREICESKYQRLMAKHVRSVHHEVYFAESDIAERLSRAVFHSECPLKEAYNTASIALSRCARDNNVTVVLNGEGSDELFAGYVGYSFDSFRSAKAGSTDFEMAIEQEISDRLWGDEGILYDRGQHSLRETKEMLYSRALNESFDEFDFTRHDLVNKERLRGRHPLHQRSYLDFKIRLAGHLISDHGDRMAMANSVEARYPFLDPDLVELARLIPPELKLNKYTEKYVLKKAAEELLPGEIISRQKFAFIAPGSPSLMRSGSEWINDMLCSKRIRKDGYFDPATVETIKKRYLQEGFKLAIPFEEDLLLFVLTFNIFLDSFKLPGLN